MNLQEAKNIKGKDYALKSASISDAPRLEKFLKGLSKETKQLFHPHPFDKIFLTKILNTERDIRLILIDESNKRIIGYAFVSRVLFFSKVGYFGIVIGDRYQGKGLGNMLMKGIVNYSKIKGINKIILNVYTSNMNAIKLYRRIGFKEIKINLLMRNVITLSETFKNNFLKDLISQLLSYFKRKPIKRDVSIWMEK